MIYERRCFHIHRYIGYGCLQHFRRICCNGKKAWYPWCLYHSIHYSHRRRNYQGCFDWRLSCKLIYNYEKTLIFFDSVGLGFFTVVGIQKGIEFGFPPGLCIALGTITACFGGLARDITLNHIPHIFHKEIYATACIVGGIIYILLLRTSLPVRIPDIICISVVVILRLFAVKYKWRLPGLYHHWGGKNSKFKNWSLFDQTVEDLGCIFHFQSTIPKEDKKYYVALKKKARPKKSRPLLTYEKHQFQI